jgi:hypothetical protein
VFGRDPGVVQVVAPRTMIVCSPSDMLAYPSPPDQRAKLL